MSADQLYRRLLVLLPRPVRQEAEAELLDVFRPLHARAVRRGAHGLVLFWIRVLVDLAAAAAAERLPSFTRATSPHRPRRSLSMRMTQLLETVLTDLRVTARRLSNTPGWTLLASGTLALGVAASLVGGVLMRDVVLDPLPFPEAGRLVRLIEISHGGRRAWWPSWPNAREWRDEARVFDVVAIAGTPRTSPVMVGGEGVRASVGGAGAELFGLLGLRPVAGRLFVADEHRAGGPPVAVVSEAFWRGALRSRPLSGTLVTIRDISYEAVGVLPAGFKFLDQSGAWTDGPDVWTPLEARTAFGGRRSHGDYHVIARLREGITLDHARGEMNLLAATLARRHGEATNAEAVGVTPLHDVVVRSAREPLQLLLYAGFAVLLVACLNLSAAILSQGLTRARELHIRGALGATRSRLAGHLLTGSVVLAVPGTLLGFLLAAAALRAIKAFAAGAWPRLDEAVLDWRATGMALAVAAVTAAAAALLPALLLSASAGRDRLRARGQTGSGEPRMWPVFVGAQVALTVLLVAASGLLVVSFLRASRVDLGYDPRHVVVVDVALPMSDYGAPERRQAYYRSALERLRALPGVTGAGLTSTLPHEPSAATASTQIDIADAKSVMSGYRLVDEDYFATVGIPLHAASARVLGSGGAIVDDRLVQQLWDGASPLGARIRNSFDPKPIDVAGVAGTVREWNEAEGTTTGAVYVHYSRQPIASMHLVIRHQPGIAASVAGSARAALHALDPRVPLRIEPFAPRVAEALRAQRLLLLVASGFGVTALLLAASGVYTMITFVVARRMREAAIRLALGAPPAELRRRVLRQGLSPAAAGSGVGLVVAYLGGPALRAHLFQVEPADPAVLVTAALVILGAALIASLPSARRSSRVDPALALREE